jgi:hypothetical protein
MPDDLRDLVVSTIEASLYARLRAVRRLLRQEGEAPAKSPRESRLSQLDMANLGHHPFSPPGPRPQRSEICKDSRVRLETGPTSLASQAPLWGPLWGPGGRGDNKRACGKPA